MRRLPLCVVLVLFGSSFNALAEETKPASGYSSLLPTEQDLEKSTAAAEAKAKADREKAQRTGATKVPAGKKSGLTLTATCKDEAGKTFTSKDEGYDLCVQKMQTAAQAKRATGTETSTDGGVGAGVQFNIGH